MVTTIGSLRPCCVDMTQYVINSLSIGESMKKRINEVKVYKYI